jgi:hypothetical protein
MSDEGLQRTTTTNVNHNGHEHEDELLEEIRLDGEGQQEENELVEELRQDLRGKAMEHDLIHTMQECIRVSNSAAPVEPRTANPDTTITKKPADHNINHEEDAITVTKNTSGSGTHNRAAAAGRNDASDNDMDIDSGRIGGGGGGGDTDMEGGDTDMEGDGGSAGDGASGGTDMEGFGDDNDDNDDEGGNTDVEGGGGLDDDDGDDAADAGLDDKNNKQVRKEKNAGGGGERGGAKEKAQDDVSVICISSGSDSSDSDSDNNDNHGKEKKPKLVVPEPVISSPQADAAAKAAREQQKAPSLPELAPDDLQKTSHTESNRNIAMSAPSLPKATALSASAAPNEKENSNLPTLATGDKSVQARRETERKDQDARQPSAPAAVPPPRPILPRQQQKSTVDRHKETSTTCTQANQRTETAGKTSASSPLLSHDPSSCDNSGAAPMPTTTERSPRPRVPQESRDTLMDTTSDNAAKAAAAERKTPVAEEQDVDIDDLERNVYDKNRVQSRKAPPPPLHRDLSSNSEAPFGGEVNNDQSSSSDSDDKTSSGSDSDGEGAVYYDPDKKIKDRVKLLESLVKRKRLEPSPSPPLPASSAVARAANAPTNLTAAQQAATATSSSNTNQETITNNTPSAASAAGPTTKKRKIRQVQLPRDLQSCAVEDKRQRKRVLFQKMFCDILTTTMHIPKTSAFSTQYLSFTSLLAWDLEQALYEYVYPPDLSSKKKKNKKKKAAAATVTLDLNAGSALSLLQQNQEREKERETKYQQKARSLNHNLKDRKNPTLVARLLNGELDAKTLVAMSPDDMKSKYQRQKVAKLAAEASREYVLMADRSEETKLPASMSVTTAKRQQATTAETEGGRATSPTTSNHKSSSRPLKAANASSILPSSPNISPVLKRKKIQATVNEDLSINIL